MASNLNYKQVNNVERRTWDLEAYEKRAKERLKSSAERLPETSNDAVEDSQGKDRKRILRNAGEEKQEFLPANPTAAGPAGSKRAYLQPRRGKVDVDSKVGTTEMVSAAEAATTAIAGDKAGSTDVVTKSGVGWHCKICDCFLKDSHTYLDHINGRKHQRKLGFSMRVQRSTKDQLISRLGTLSKAKDNKKELSLDNFSSGYEGVVRAKDEKLAEKKAERARRRKEKKQQKKEVEDEEQDDGQVDVAALMGFSSFA